MAILQSQLSATQAAQASLTSQLERVSSDKSALITANESLQQALMEKTQQAAQGAEALRQQQAKQLAALRAQHQQHMEEAGAAAAAAEEAHKQVRSKIQTGPAL